MLVRNRAQGGPARPSLRSSLQTRKLHTSFKTEKSRPNQLMARAARGPRKPMIQKRKEMEVMRGQNAALNKTAKNAGYAKDWALKTSIIIQRPALLAPEPPEWLQKYTEWRTRWTEPFTKNAPKLEDYLSTIEEESEKLGIAKKPIQGASKGPSDETPEEKKAREDREKRVAELKKAYEVVKEKQVGPRITAADKLNDRKSLRRKLDANLFLVVKKNRQEHSWFFPAGWREETTTDTMRQTAEKRLADTVGTSIQTYFTGNAPIGCYTYPFPEGQQKQMNTYGAKSFFYYGWYIQGNLKIARPDIVDHAWVTRKELPEYITDAKTMEYVDQILPYEVPFVPGHYNQ